MAEIRVAAVQAAAEQVPSEARFREKILGLAGRAPHLGHRVRRAVLLNGIALPDCAATVPTPCCGWWNLTCWAMPTGWRRRGLAQWEKVCPGIRARGLPDLAVTALAKLPRCPP